MLRNTKFRYYALTVLLAFAANAILPFFAVYSPHPGDLGIERLSSVFGEKILLCTGEGFKWVKLADLRSGREKPKPHSGYQCPLCYAASHGLKSMALLPVFAVQHGSRGYTPVFAYDPPAIALHLASALRVRAPPVSFIG